MIVRNIDERVKYSLEPALPILKDTTDWNSIINHYKSFSIPGTNPIQVESYNFSQAIYFMNNSVISLSGTVTITKCGKFIWVYDTNPENKYYPILTTSPGPILSNCMINTGSYQIGYNSSKNCIVTVRRLADGYVGD